MICLILLTLAFSGERPLTVNATEVQAMYRNTGWVNSGTTQVILRHGYFTVLESPAQITDLINKCGR